MILYFQQKRKTEMLSARLPSLLSDIEKGAFYEQRKTCVCRKETCLCSKSKGTETWDQTLSWYQHCDSSPWADPLWRGEYLRWSIWESLQDRICRAAGRWSVSWKIWCGRGRTCIFRRIPSRTVWPESRFCSAVCTVPGWECSTDHPFSNYLCNRRNRYRCRVWGDQTSLHQPCGFPWDRSWEAGNTGNSIPGSWGCEDFWRI